MGTPQQALRLLEELTRLRFPDDLFKRIHPFDHPLQTFQRYCVGKRSFLANSSSHALCERMVIIVGQAREVNSRDLDRVAWQRMVADALQQHPRLGDGNQLAGNNILGSGRYRRLESHHQYFIAQQIAGLVPVALDTGHSMSRVARWQIRNTLWRWTVDGVDADGMVQIDAAKRNPGLLPMTKLAYEAIATRSSSADLKRIHEHVVPREVIACHLLERDARTAEEVLAVLRCHCFAAVVTKQEERCFAMHGVKDSMPAGWRWGDDCWARYKQAGLYDELIWPADWPHDLR